ncbi:MAG: hypothetical protein ACI8XO_001986 [Verrucomicrobiales bacterium]|jgi:hypothetical protein
MIPVSPRFYKPKRIVEPEILDSLPADAPDAIRSRQDLLLVNALMGNQRWILKQIDKHRLGRSGENWELGAGDGSLGAAVARKFGCGINPFTALDFSPRSPRWPESWHWDQRDILAVAEESPAADLVVANLLLHHFEDDGLARIGRWIADRASSLIAVEPLRAHFPHALAYALRLAGINYVTREDIHTSIDAGFQGEELPDLLGLDRQIWDVEVSTNLLGAYQVIATKRS